MNCVPSRTGETRISFHKRKSNRSGTGRSCPNGCITLREAAYAVPAFKKKVQRVWMSTNFLYISVVSSSYIQGRCSPLPPFSMSGLNADNAQRISSSFVLGTAVSLRPAISLPKFRCLKADCNMFVIAFLRPPKSDSSPTQPENITYGLNDRPVSTGRDIIRARSPLTAMELKKSPASANGLIRPTYPLTLGPKAKGSVPSVFHPSTPK
eukprot:15040_5